MHCETTTGILNPIQEIGRLVKAAGKIWIVDAMSSFGGVPMDMAELEIDFLISNNSKLKYKLYPIEVKSGRNYSVKSLASFRDKYSKRIGRCYIIHPRNLTERDGFLCIPPYMTICL